MPERLSRLQTSLPELNRVQDDHIRVLNPVLGKDALQDDGAWHGVGEQGEPPFLNGWYNFNAVTWQGVRFRKDRFGRVQIEGLMAGGTLGLPAFVLPNGYRPLRSHAFPGRGDNAGTYAVGWVDVLADGIVRPLSVGAAYNTSFFLFAEFQADGA